MPHKDDRQQLMDLMDRLRVNDARTKDHQRRISELGVESAVLRQGVTDLIRRISPESLCIVYDGFVYQVKPTTGELVLTPVLGVRLARFNPVQPQPDLRTLADDDSGKQQGDHPGRTYIDPDSLLMPDMPLPVNPKSVLDNLPRERHG